MHIKNERNTCNHHANGKQNHRYLYLTDVLKKAKGRFLKPEKFQNHSNEGKGKEKKKERGEGKKEKRKK